MAKHTTGPKRALAIADIIEHELTVVDEVEGHLLVAAGRTQNITPAALGHETVLSRDAASDLFRQLEQTRAIRRESHDGSVAKSDYTVDSDPLRESFDATRRAIEIISSYRKREPATEVTPLVTFPDDPSFANTMPAAFGMDGLMSTLASEIKGSNNQIYMLSPFFEHSGFDRLAGVLLDALERGVNITIVTRYLQDADSHNYSVVGDFVRRARGRDVDDDLTTIDYTVWDPDTPRGDRHQDGQNPAFTLHAKVMSFDRRSVYVGSANVTDYGFSRYLELGVLLGRSEASQFVRLCEFLIESNGATPVSL